MYLKACLIDVRRDEPHKHETVKCKCSLHSRSLYAGGIWKRKFHSKNASNVFRSHYDGGLILDLCLGKTRSGKSHGYRDAIVFWKPSFSNCFTSALKRKPGVFKFLCLKSVFDGKVPFSWRISVDVRPNHWNKATFSVFSGVEWNRPNNPKCALNVKAILRSPLPAHFSTTAHQ